MTSSLSQRVAEWVTNRLRIEGKTQKQLADHLGIYQASVSRKLRGIDNFQLDQLDAVAEFFGVTVTDVLGGRVAGNSGKHSVSTAPTPPVRASRTAESDWTDPRPPTPPSDVAGAA
jgi:transcriptional regulator with XRE-family HTH domain